MKKNIYGFSLIELSVVIAIIMILTISISRINLNPQINNQKFLEFNNQISSNIETARNNSLIGKGVGTSLQTPDYWNINIGTGNLDTSYFIGATKYNYDDINVNFDKLNNITGFRCLTITGTTLSSPTKVDIQITGSNITLSGCTNSNSKILDIKTKNTSFSGTIRVNTVTGLIEKK